MGLKAIAENAGGALLIAASLATPCLRGRRTRWGTTDGETRRTLPGDDLVPHPKWQWTHAVTIGAPAAAVWPWVVQVGQGRGGFYSYELLENMVGCRIRNADCIVPQWQHLDVGDEVLLHPRSPGLSVAIVEPGRALVLLAGDWSPRELPSSGDEAKPAASFSASWLWFLDPIDETGTRLISRWRGDYGQGLSNSLTFGPLFVEPVGFVMSRKMLLGIKQRAEAAAGQDRRQQQPR